MIGDKQWHHDGKIIFTLHAVIELPHQIDAVTAADVEVDQNTALPPSAVARYQSGLWAASVTA